MKKTIWNIAKYTMLLVMILFTLHIINPVLPKSFFSHIKMDNIRLTFLFYVFMAVMVIAFLSILALSNKVSGEKFGLTFPWKQFKPAWFIVIAVLWILPNTLNTQWSFPALDLYFIISVVMAPIIEELIFRGFLQGLFPNKMLWKWGKLDVGVVLMAIVFALWHFNILQPSTIMLIPFFLHFMGGITLGMLRNKTGAIWLGVVVHALGNLIAQCHGLQ